MPILLFLIPFIIILYIILFYNKVVSFKVKIKASIQEIGNQLKRQADLIPNLTESVKGYLEHEKEIFNELSEARKAILQATQTPNADELLKTYEKTNKIFSKFIGLMESTPQLKGSEPVMKLMDELRDTADKIMYSRRVLIDLTADYNESLVKFPNNFIAQIFKFTPERGLVTPEEGEHLEVSTQETKTPKINF